MGIYLNPGNRNMQIARNGNFYVDKSMQLDVLNSKLDTESRYICISRPRRFGKSMAAEMICAYYDRSVDSHNLFDDLKIASAESYEKHLNKYNVIHLDMNDFSDLDVEGTLKKIKLILTKDIKKIYPDLEYTYEDDFQITLQDVYNQTGIPFIVVIDEWDNIMRSHNYTETDRKKYLDFLKQLFKGKSYIALAYMTGILPIKKYGEHSALNNFTEFSMEDQAEFAAFTGFTEDEVAGLQEKYKFDFDEAKLWYNGYNVNGIATYNPRSIVEMCSRKRFSSYWTKTETYEALKKYIQMNFDGLREKVEAMIGGESVKINTAKFKNDMTNLESADDVLALLIHLGYLTYDNISRRCWIPNYEVQTEFINCIEDGGWEEVMNSIQKSEDCLNALLEGDADTVARLIELAHQNNTSIIKYNDENSLACIVTLALYTANRKYQIIRELPTGKGYADLAFIPHPKVDLPAIVVELKKEQSESIAIKQIKEKNYADCLKDYSGEVILVGVNYDENKHHTCVIEKIIK